MNVEQIHLHPKYDDILFKELTALLPAGAGAAGIPYGSNSHSIQYFRDALQLALPRRVLEIGFNLGYSSAIWLELGIQQLTAVDISTRPETLEAAETLTKMCPLRFCYYNRKNLPESHDFFDLIFIDGDHSERGVLEDIDLGLRLGIEHFFFDDWFPHWGPGTQPAIAQRPLKIRAILGNMVLCQKTDETWV